MSTHVKILGALFIALSALGLLAALALVFTFGLSAGIVGLTADPVDAEVAQPVLVIIGTVLTTFLLVVSLPGIVVGWGLLTFKPWARIFGIVLSAPPPHQHSLRHRTRHLRALGALQRRNGTAVHRARAGGVAAAGRETRVRCGRAKS